MSWRGDGEMVNFPVTSELSQKCGFTTEFKVANSQISSSRSYYEMVISKH